MRSSAESILMNRKKNIKYFKNTRWVKWDSLASMGGSPFEKVCFKYLFIQRANRKLSVFLHYFSSKDSREFPYISYVTRRVHNITIFNSQTLCNGYSILLMWTRQLLKTGAKSARESYRLRVLVFHNIDKDITLPGVLYERDFTSRLTLSKIHPLTQETSIYAYIHIYFQVKIFYTQQTPAVYF